MLTKKGGALMQMCRVVPQTQEVIHHKKGSTYQNIEKDGYRCMIRVLWNYRYELANRVRRATYTDKEQSPTTEMHQLAVFNNIANRNRYKERIAWVVIVYRY